VTDRTVPRDVVPLLFAAMAIFVVTVVMGILNGTDLMELPHGALLAHVHSGTLGWITLSIFAAAAWILGTAGMPRLLRDGSIAAVVLYVAAFWIDINAIRPVAGVLTLAAIVWFAVWAFRARGGHAFTVPSLAITLAAINLVIGGFLGVVLGLAHAGLFDISSELAGAHPAMMVVGYLILAGSRWTRSSWAARAPNALPGSGPGRRTCSSAPGSPSCSASCSTCSRCSG
jgi:hypothetical protein